ncbi:MAG: hypothetical protein ACRC7G_17685 [Beijerinckiaceae bacterium]
MSVSIVKPLESAMDEVVSSVRLPKVNDGPVAGTPDNALADPNPLFGLLVQGERDVPGLLAYSLYKQNKRDWLIAFEAKQDRAPTDAEIDAFILGERIPRRLQTYRRLAEDMLGVRQPSGAANDQEPAIPAGNATMQAAAALSRKGAWRTILFLLALVIAMAVVFRFAASYLFG